MNNIEIKIPTDTWLCLSIIAIAFTICFICVFKFKNRDKLVANRRIIEYFPTFISTLGVLGTFWGITKGLMAFEATNLDQSIPRSTQWLKNSLFHITCRYDRLYDSISIYKSETRRERWWYL